MHTSLEFRRDDRFSSPVPQDAPLRPVLVALALLAGLAMAVIAASLAGALPSQGDLASLAGMEMTGP